MESDTNTQEMSFQEMSSQLMSSQEMSAEEMSSQEIVLSNPLLLETIFRHLAPADIKAVSLVSRSSIAFAMRKKNVNS